MLLSFEEALRAFENTGPDKELLINLLQEHPVIPAVENYIEQEEERIGIHEAFVHPTSS